MLFQKINKGGDRLEVDMVDIINFIFLAVIPLLIKFLNDLKNIYVELKTELVEHKTKIEELKEDVQRLESCLSDLKKMIMEG